ncbi:hypothetical protein ACPCSF_34385 [Streptomyces griseoincarnatus]
MNYLLNPVYGWAEGCLERFGTHPTPILHDGNRREHLVDYEGGQERRPMTREECQLLFDHIDDRVDRMIKRGRKGALTAYRDSTLFKTIYGWGLRVSETSGLDRLDLCTQMQSAVLQRLLGISPAAAERWAAGAIRTEYAAEVARRSDG